MLEILSVIFNNFFHKIWVFGIHFNLNISVVFFCTSFFILDLVTELYDGRCAEKFIISKIIVQPVFVICAEFAIHYLNLTGTVIDGMISSVPYIILYGIIASVFGYGITIKIMEELKVRYQGEYLSLRYLLSTYPGEIAFSIIFSVLCFFHGRNFHEWLNIFISLSIAKLILSLLFCLIMAPVTNLIKYFGKFNTKKVFQYVPFI